MDRPPSIMGRLRNCYGPAKDVVVLSDVESVLPIFTRTEPELVRSVRSFDATRPLPYRRVEAGCPLCGRQGVGLPQPFKRNAGGQPPRGARSMKPQIDVTKQ